MMVQLKSGPADEDVIIELSGPLDEKIQFPDLSVRLRQRVIFECEKIEHVSSFAAQRWSVWMKSKDERQQFVFRKVPVRVIDLFNMVDGYLPPEVVVESFFVPYECAHCEHEEHVLARRGREYVEAAGGHKARILLPEEMNCPKCKNGMKLGAWEDKYLRFLESDKK